MKTIKNVWLAINSFFILALAVSCSSKDNNPAPPVVPKPTVTSISPDTAQSGATVTITGTNLTGATAVSFGGIPATSFNVTNATTIAAVVGAGGSGDVVVTTPGGTATLSGFVLKAPDIDGFGSSDDIQPAYLIAHWPFDGSTTELKNNASPVLMGGAQTYVTGKIGQALHLESGWLTYGPESTGASADNTTYASNDTLQNGFTLSMWTQAPFSDDLATLFMLASPNIPNWPLMGIQFRKHTGSSTFDFDAGISNVDGTGPHVSYNTLFKEPAFVDTASWAFITMKYTVSETEKSLKYYANGELVQTFDLLTQGGTFPDPAASLLMIAPNYPIIGAAESRNTVPGSVNDPVGFMSYGMTGTIDDIRLFKATLTDDEIKALYHLGSAGR